MSVARPAVFEPRYRVFADAPASNPGWAAALGAEWRSLERRAADPSFFQSWTWVGCLAEERFPRPLVVRAEAPCGRLLGLALFNRRAFRLCLGESGDTVLDKPFVEHNAPLLAAEAPPGTLTAMLAEAVRAAGPWRRLVLGGVPPELAAAAAAAGGGDGMAVWRQQDRPAPFVDLEAVRREAGGDYLATLSANARQQLRRSIRRYAEGGGAPAAQAAATAAEARGVLAGLAALHQEGWARRGRPGAFATPFFWRFHEALLPVALARSELDLLRVTAGTEVVGYLYNFRFGGRVHAYQSGFAPPPAGDTARKPGLTCHLLAIERALTGGERVYDLMAGEQRYKRTLAPRHEATLRWVELVTRGSPLDAVLWLRFALRRNGR